MKKFSLFILGCSLIPALYPQSGYIPVDEMNSILHMAKVLNISGDTLSAYDIIPEGKPVAFLFTFSGCMGCKISLEETILPNYQQLHEKYGLEIFLISKDKGDARLKSKEEYKSLPVTLFFDIDNSLFSGIPPTPWKDGSLIKAWPTIFIIGKDLDGKLSDPFSTLKIEETIKGL